MKKIGYLISFSVMIAVMMFSLNAYANDINDLTAVSDNTQYQEQIPVDISSAGFTASLSYTSVNYSGQARTPKAYLNYNGTALSLNKDYTVEYSNNINAGKATVKFTGIGSYTGTLKQNFTINKLSFTESKKVSVTLSGSTFTYSGTENKPVVTVSYKIGSNTVYLMEGTDYTLSYSKNTNPGKATVKIKGTGNYKDSVSKDFIIVPKSVGSLKCSDITASTLTLSWSKASGASGYEVLKYNSSKKTYEHYAYASSNTVSLKNIPSGKTAKFRIKPYKTIDKKKYYGAASKAVSAVMKPSQVVIDSVTKNSGKIDIQWRKVSCSGYEIFYSTDRNMKKSVKSVKVSSSKKSYTLSKINKSKHYYVKIRAYVKSGKKTVYGQKSATLGSYFSNVYATYSSNYVNNANRTTNLKIASDKINGTIVQPGETFSFNKVVGSRTAAKGYKSAPIFSGSSSVSNGIGGGICQVASTMFNCALKANVTITERHQHSQRVSYVPLGRDAAIYGNTEDLKWTNNTKYPIQVKMKVENGVISCTFYTCTKAKPKKTELKVTQSGNKFTLNRIVGGKSNYKTTSVY